MDEPLSGEVLFTDGDPQGIGGVYSVKAPCASVMEEQLQLLINFLADQNNGGSAVGNPPTLATCITGLSLGAAGDGASFVATLSVEPFDAEIQAGNWEPSDQVPVWAITGQYAATGGWAGLSCVDAFDVDDLRKRIAKRNQTFSAEQQTLAEQTAQQFWVPEVQIAGAGAGRIYMACLLWSFDLRAP